MYCQSDTVGEDEIVTSTVVVQLDLSVAGNGKRRREVNTDEVRLWASGAGLPDSSLIEVSAREGTDVLAVFHRRSQSSVRWSTVPHFLSCHRLETSPPSS